MHNITSSPPLLGCEHVPCEKQDVDLESEDHNTHAFVILLAQLGPQPMTADINQKPVSTALVATDAAIHAHPISTAKGCDADPRASTSIKHEKYTLTDSQGRTGPLIPYAPTTSAPTRHEQAGAAASPLVILQDQRHGTAIVFSASNALPPPNTTSSTNLDALSPGQRQPSMPIATVISRMRSYSHAYDSTSAMAVAIPSLSPGQPTTTGTLSGTTLDNPYTKASSIAISESESWFARTSPSAPENDQEMQDIHSTTIGANASSLRAEPDSRAQPASSSANTLLINAKLSDAKWPAALGSRFLNLVQHAHTNPNTVELRLDPPELGPLRISISMTDNVAQAAFLSPQPAVRHAVENALPQLQLMLSQAGISLGETSISDHPPPGPPFEQGQQATKAHANASGQKPAVVLPSEAQTGKRLANGLIDTFA